MQHVLCGSAGNVNGLLMDKTRSARFLLGSSSASFTWKIGLKVVINKTPLNLFLPKASCCRFRPNKRAQDTTGSGRAYLPIPRERHPRWTAKMSSSGQRGLRRCIVVHRTDSWQAVAGYAPRAAWHARGGNRRQVHAPSRSVRGRLGAVVETHAG